MKGAIYYVAIAKVIFSHVKISSFRAKAHLVFHWCLYNKITYSLFYDNFWQVFKIFTCHPNSTQKCIYQP